MKKKILIQFDPDPHASTFDSVVAIDSGVDHLLTQPAVTPDDVESLVHGAMFTRGSKDLKSTALFFGGSNVVKTEALVDAAKQAFFGPVRVSLMSDPNGSNTTAAAAVLCVQKHVNLDNKHIVILAGTGPVGQRIARIIASVAGVGSAKISLCSRRLEKANDVCDAIKTTVASSGNESMASIDWNPLQVSNPAEATKAIETADVVFAAGAAGIELLGREWQSLDRKLILVDINAVPPSGIADVGVMDAGEERGNAICYGAIGVGGLKMKIHKQAIKSLFDSNDQVLETEAIYRIGAEL